MPNSVEEWRKLDEQERKSEPSQKILSICIFVSLVSMWGMAVWAL